MDEENDSDERVEEDKENEGEADKTSTIQVCLFHLLIYMLMNFLGPMHIFFCSTKHKLAGDSLLVLNVLIKFHLLTTLELTIENIVTKPNDLNLTEYKCRA